jgi:hypothetical protein
MAVEMGPGPGNPVEVTVVTDLESCANCTHSWHGLPCRLRTPLHTAPGGICPCPGAFGSDVELIT